MLRLSAAVVFGAICLAQAPSAREPLRWPYPGLTPAKPVKQVEPEYSKEALEIGVQGISLFEIVIDEQGRPGSPRLLSPIGYGLDERAREAILQWRFEPARLDGAPVSVYGQIEAAFRLHGSKFDLAAEHQRTQFNRSMHMVKLGGDARTRGIESIQQLSKEGMVAALHAEAKWILEGSLESREPDRGLTLLKEAAGRNYPPALYDFGVMLIRGDGVEKNQRRGFDLVREASKRGNTYAQFYLGSAYENGPLVKIDLNQALTQYQLCAARAVPLCQYRVARLLLDRPKRKGSDLVEAVAWLQLAVGHGVEDARRTLDETVAQCTPDQRTQIDRLRPRLEKPPIQIGQPIE